MIARKIAYAALVEPDRPSTDGVTDDVAEELIFVLSKWLSTDPLKINNISVTWTRDVAIDLPPNIISAKGETNTSRVAIAVSDHFSKVSTCRLLLLPETTEADDMKSLRAFVDQNMTDLGRRLSATRRWTERLPETVIWTNENEETLVDLYRDIDVVRIDIQCCELGTKPSSITLMATPDLLGLNGNDEDENDSEHPVKTLPPRLGPCEVEIKAIADRVTMSVADCSRLEIGQIVKVPGLRFDKLELSIAMVDGSVPLVDAALGADKGRKAVRLNRGLDPEFHLPLEEPASVHVPREKSAA